MRAVVQRVTKASVEVEGEVIGEIGQGLLVLLGAGDGDDSADVKYLLGKILNMRIFADEEGKMNLSLLGIEGEMLVVSQFTLYGDTRKGRRPSFVRALHPDQAKGLVEEFISGAKREGVAVVEQGKFGADMKVSLLNDGPVTIMIDSEKTM